ncbi:MAG: FkbM family methyltransferase [Anaerolineae bacterium]|nr:FkbM family methyltransferase [Anaerolineae bacterium]
MPSKNPLVPFDFVHAAIVERESESLKLLTFPGGFRCYTHSSIEETEQIYNEIMVKQEYLGHGLSIDGARCVFDVGANIGLFTFLVKSRSPDTTVHAFEPVKETYDIFMLNVRLWGFSGVHAYNVAVGSQEQREKTLVFYPNMAGNATFSPAIKQTQREMMNRAMGKEATDFFFRSETRVVQVKTLSSAIEESEVTSIDYLKIDVEGDEVSVLEGVAEQHWPLVRQIAVEVHSPELLEKVRARLIDRGFQVHSDVGLSAAAGASNLYARRS